MPLETANKELDEKIELTENENIACYVRRHWMALLPKALPPFVVALLSIGAFFFRAAGGKLIYMDQAFAQRLDIVNITLGVLLLIIAMFTFLVLRGKDNKQIRQLLLFIGGVIAILIGYRYVLGGRIFHMPSGVIGSQTFDVYNIILLGITIISAALAYYEYYEWNDDFLILTNNRVITWHQVLLGKHSQKEISIENIQNVGAKTSSYLEYWLNYGNVSITSASFGPSLNFEKASKPVEMQKAISDAVKKSQGSVTQSNFADMIDKKIYNPPPPKAPKAPSGEAAKRNIFTEVRDWFFAIFAENPQIADDGTITWRPHNIFVLASLIKPMAFLIISFVAVIFLEKFYPIDFLVVALVMIGVIVVFLIWAAWNVEDVRNEVYILSPTNVTDIEQKPFGPRDSNSANLGSIQNVTHKTTLFGRWFGYGDVIVETAGKAEPLTFKSLPKPNNVASKINEYRANHKKGEKQRALNDTVTLIKHYHDAQLKHNELLNSLLEETPPTSEFASSSPPPSDTPPPSSPTPSTSPSSS